MTEKREIPDITKLEDVSRILIVRYFALGDIALSLPIVSAMRESFPDAHISYLCWKRYEETLAGDTGLDRVLAVEPGTRGWISAAAGLRRERIDIAIDLLTSPGSSLLTRMTGARMRIGMDTGRQNWCFHHVLPRGVFREGQRITCYTLHSNRHLARSLGLGTSAAGNGQGSGRRDLLETGFPAAASEARWADGYFSSLTGGKEGFAGIVPDAKYSSKSWPEEYFIELAKEMEPRLGLTPIIIWGPGEEDLAARITENVPGSVLLPPLGIARLGAVIARLKILIGVDSGPKHLAVIQGVPTVTIFGPTDPGTWDPVSGRHAVLFRGLECSPCREKDCSENVCMSGIRPGEVLEEAARVLDMEEEY